VIFYPPSAIMTNNQSYVDVLSMAPRLVFFGTLAMFAGDIANSYVLAKMKVWTNGLYISARFVTSTLCGQVVNMLDRQPVRLNSGSKFHTDFVPITLELSSPS
jgi:queuosine precursor transporter